MTDIRPCRYITITALVIPSAKIATSRNGVSVRKQKRMLIEKEIYTDCTVIICEDDETGEIDISWYRNDKPPKLIITELEEEEE